MSAPATSFKLKHLLRRFRRNQEGVIAVEMGFIALPFFALLFAIIETGIVFFAR